MGSGAVAAAHCRSPMLREFIADSLAQATLGEKREPNQLKLVGVARNPGLA